MFAQDEGSGDSGDVDPKWRCTDSSTPPTPSISASISNVTTSSAVISASYDEVTLSGYTVTHSFYWNDGNRSKSRTVNTEGTYTATVDAVVERDGNICSSSARASVTVEFEDPPPTPTQEPCDNGGTPPDCSCGGQARCVPRAPAPSSVTATATSCSSVRASWSAVDGATEYRASLGGNSVTTSRTSTAWSRLSENTNYTVAVKARGDGDPYSTSYGSSRSDSVITPACNTPSPPPPTSAPTQEPTSTGDGTTSTGDETVPVLPSSIGPYSRTSPGSITRTLPAATGGNSPLTYSATAIDSSASGSITSFNASTQTIVVNISSAPQTFRVRYKVTDNDGDFDSKTITFQTRPTPRPQITPPGVAPDFRTYSRGTTSIFYRWNPATAGTHPIDGYDFRYRTGDNSQWTVLDDVSTSTNSGAPESLIYQLSPLAPSTTHKAQVRAVSTNGTEGPWSGTVTASTNAADPKPAQPRIIASRPYGPVGAGREMGEKEARVRLTWNKVPGDGITYKVQIWDRVGVWPSPLFIFKDLPVSGFSLSGPYDSEEVVGQLHAMVGNLHFDHDYEFRIVAVKGEHESMPTEDDEYDVHTTPPFYGRQADHTVQYEIGQAVPTRKVTDPTGYDPETAIRTSISDAVTAWNNSSVGRSTPNLHICEKASGCSSRPNDHRVTTIRFNSKACKTPWAFACVQYTGDASSFADSDSHMNNLIIWIEEPAKERDKDRHGKIIEPRTLWTSNSTLDELPHADYEHTHHGYLPQKVMHEFGHTFGLYDLYNAGWFCCLPGSVMGKPDGTVTEHSRRRYHVHTRGVWRSRTALAFVQ